MAWHGKAQTCTRVPRRGAEEWRILVANLDIHEGTKAEFIRVHGISPGSLLNWRGKRGTAGLVKIEAPGFPRATQLLDLSVRARTSASAAMGGGPSCGTDRIDR